MYGIGYALSGTLLGSSNDNILSNPLANHFYYNKLVVANGGVENFHTYYGISLSTFKSAINTIFTSLDSCGLTTKIKRWTPRIGSIADTQCVNAISVSTTYDGAFDGVGTTFSTDGAIYNGVSAFEETNFPCNSWTSVSNMGFSFKNFDATISNNRNVLSEASFNTYLYKDPLNRFLFYPNSSNYVSAPVGVNFFTFSRDGLDVTTYIDGVQYFTPITVSDSIALNSNEIYIAKDGGGLGYLDSTLAHEIFHDKLTSSEAMDLYNIINTFDTALGR